MELYFLRHGPAASAEQAGVDTDAQRPLIPEAAALCARLGRLLRALGVRFDVIAASPLKRARQTADAVGEAMGAKERVLVTDTLSPGCTLTSLSDFVRTHRRAERVALVGHEPDMSTLVEELTGGGRAHLGAGAVARVDTEEIAPGAGELRLLLPPELTVLFGGPAD